MKEFVPVKSLLELSEGDIVRGKRSGLAYVVGANYTTYVIATRVQHISQPVEWLVLREAPDPIAAAVRAELEPLAEQLTEMGHKLAKEDERG